MSSGRASRMASRRNSSAVTSYGLNSNFLPRRHRNPSEQDSYLHTNDTGQAHASTTTASPSYTPAKPATRRPPRSRNPHSRPLMAHHRSRRLRARKACKASTAPRSRPGNPASARIDGRRWSMATGDLRRATRTREPPSDVWRTVATALKLPRWTR